MSPGPHHVVLVRPWVDAHAGSGCCSGDARDGIGLEHRVTGPIEHPHATRVLAKAYTQLRRDLPEIDVQIVSSSNTVYLVPTVLRAAGRGAGLRGAMRAANRATRPGSVLVDGEYAGDVTELGPGGVVEVVRARVG